MAFGSEMCVNNAEDYNGGGMEGHETGKPYSNPNAPSVECY